MSNPLYVCVHITWKLKLLGGYTFAETHGGDMFSMVKSETLCGGHFSKHKNVPKKPG